jgi:hypothetical protein
MKTCTRCKAPKDVALFAKRSSASDGLASWCKSCFAENAAAKYQADPRERERKTRNRTATVERSQEFLWNYLLDHPCIDCKNDDPRVLEFDHIDETTKVSNVVELMTYSVQKIIEEIAKCVVRCANCHRIRTQEQFGTWRSKRLTPVARTC